MSWWKEIRSKCLGKPTRILNMEPLLLGWSEYYTQRSVCVNEFCFSVLLPTGCNHSETVLCLAWNFCYLWGKELAATINPPFLTFLFFSLSKLKGCRNRGTSWKRKEHFLLNHHPSSSSYWHHSSSEETNHGHSRHMYHERCSGSVAIVDRVRLVQLDSNICLP